MHNKVFLSFLYLLFTFSCTAQNTLLIESLSLDEQHTLILSDSAQAAETLLSDKTDRYFELVTASEMSIQMKKPLEAKQTREDILPAFLDYLRNDVESFSPEESILVAEVMQEIFATCNKVSPGIFPDTLILIKTKGNHYGKSVYYTRENTIVIPEGVMVKSMRKVFHSTMFHELFHVYSRLNPEKRNQLYKLIGFEPIGQSSLQVPKDLAARVLYNPDGVDFAQKISLKTEDGKTIHAIPVIFSRDLGYQAGKRQFFAYVDFNLYQIEKDDSGHWKVLTKEDGYTSTLSLRELPDFFRQIKDNTNYIIHPDEVLADNFLFLMREKNDSTANAKFSAEGKKLIADMEQVLKK